MSAGDILLWIIFPYVAVAVFIVGTWWRYRVDQFGWTSHSTQLFESRILGWAGPAFHYGALAAVGGHVIGLLIPKSFTQAIGMSEHTYRWFAAIAGAVAAAVCVVGFVGLVYRRVTNVRVRRTTSRTDLLVYLLLVVLIGLGCWMTFAHNLLTKSPYDYRDSMSVWWRSLFILQPNVAAVKDANEVYQLHAIIAWAFWALFPFSRLVHAWSIPLQYLGRPYILYRRRYPSQTPGEGPVSEAPDRAPATQLTLATLAFGICFYAWSLLGPLGPDLQDALGLSDVQTSVMVAVPVLLGSLMRIPLGWLTDRVGGRRVFVWLMAYTLLPLVALAIWHDSFGAVIAFGFLLGFTGASFAVGVPFVNAWYPPERRGFALGVYGMGMGGTVVAGLTAPRIADAWGLAAPFWVAAGLLAVMAAVFTAFARVADGRPGPRVGMLDSLSVFRTSGRAWALTLFYFLAFGGFVAMFLYLPKLLTGVYDLTKADAGARAAGFALLAVIGRPTGGWLADRVGAARVLLISFVSVAVLAAILAIAYESMVPLTIACLALALALGLGTGAVFKLVPEWFPDRVGSVTGVVGAAGGLGGFFPPLVMGVVKSATGGYAVGFLLMAVVALVSLGVLAAVEPRRTAPVGRAEA